MQIGSEFVQPNDTFEVKSLVVDDVASTVGGTCTIFQRMNEKGDMLRVATNGRSH